MKQFFLERRREAILIPLLVLALSALTFIGTRLYATYRNTVNVALLQSKVDGIIADQESERRKLREELDEVNRTLYDALVDVQATKTAAKRRPSSMEAWMINKLKTLDDKNREQDNRDREHARRIYQLEQER